MSQYLNQLFETAQSPQGDFNQNAYESLVSKHGQHLRVWNNEAQDYQDIDSDEFMIDYQSEGGKYVFAEPKGYFVNQDGNMIKSEGQADVYNYIRQGFKPLDSTIVRAMGKETKDLETGDVIDDALLNLGKFGLAVRNIKGGAGNIFGALNHIYPRERSEEIELSEAKRRSPVSSAIGTLTGFGVGLGGDIGMIGKIGKGLGLTKAYHGSKVSKNLVGRNLALGAGYSAPASIVRAVGERDFMSGIETMAWGTLGGAGFGVAGAGLAKGFGKIARGTSRLADSVAGALNRGYLGHRKVKQTKAYLANIKNNAIFMMKNADEISPVEKLDEKIDLLLSPEEKLKIFGSKEKVTISSIRQKADKIWDGINDTKKSDLGLALGGVKGGNYENVIAKIDSQNMGIKKDLESVLGAAKRVQGAEIARNQEIKKQLQSSDFIERVYKANPVVGQKALDANIQVSTSHLRESLKKLDEKVIPEKGIGDLLKKESNKFYKLKDSLKSAQVAVREQKKAFTALDKKYKNASGTLKNYSEYNKQFVKLTENLKGKEARVSRLKEEVKNFGKGVYEEKGLYAKYNDFNRKFFKWTEQLRSKNKKLAQDSYFDTLEDMVKLRAFLNKTGKLTSDEVERIASFYDDYIPMNPEGVKVASDVALLERLASPKSGRLTNNENDKIIELARKYNNVKNPFNMRVFKGDHTKEGARKMSLSLIEDRKSLIFKDDLVKLVNSVFRPFTKASRGMRPGLIKQQKLMLRGMFNAMENKNAIDVFELNKIRSSISQFYKLYSSTNKPLEKNLFNTLSIKLSNLENEKLLKILSDKQFKSLLTDAEKLGIKRHELLKKQNSLNIRTMDELQIAGGLDISAFILKDILPVSMGSGALLAGATGALGIGTGTLLALFGGSTLAFYAGAQAMKRGAGLRGMATFARGFRRSVDNSIDRVYKMRRPAYWVDNLTQGKITTGEFSVPKTAAVSIQDLSEFLFGEEVDDTLDFQVMLKTAMESELDNSSVFSAMDELLLETNTQTPENTGVLEAIKANLLQTIADTIGVLDKKLPDYQRQLDKRMRNLDIVFNPFSLFEHIKSKTLTQKMIENFRRVYPKLWAKIRNNMIEESEKEDIDWIKKFNLDTRYQLNALFDYDFTGTRGGFNVAGNFTRMPKIGEEFDRKVQYAEKQKTQNQRIQTL